MTNSKHEESRSSPNYLLLVVVVATVLAIPMAAILAQQQHASSQSSFLPTNTCPTNAEPATYFPHIASADCVGYPFLTATANSAQSTFFYDLEDDFLSTILLQHGWSSARSHYWPKERALRTARLVLLIEDSDHGGKIRRTKITDEKIISALPDDALIVTKGNLAKALHPGTSHENKRWSTFHPRTWRLYIKEECEAFFEKGHLISKMWVEKPTHSSNGRGVIIHQNISALQLQHLDEEQTCYLAGSDTNANDYGVIVQELIQDPLLARGGRKTEIRGYWLAITGKLGRFIVLWHDGLVRVNSKPFKPGNWHDPLIHITNVEQQQSHPNYTSQEFRDSLKMSYAALEQELVDQRGDTYKGFVQRTLVPAMQSHVTSAFQAIMPHLRRRQRSFALYGADFLITQTLQLWLSELQLGPGMSMSSDTKRTLVPSLLRGALDLVLAVDDSGGVLPSDVDMHGWSVLLDETKGRESIPQQADTGTPHPNTENW